MRLKIAVTSLDRMFHPASVQRAKSQLLNGGKYQLFISIVSGNGYLLKIILN